MLQGQFVTVDLKGKVKIATLTGLNVERVVVRRMYVGA